MGVGFRAQSLRVLEVRVLELGPLAVESSGGYHVVYKVALVEMGIRNRSHHLYDYRKM